MASGVPGPTKRELALSLVDDRNDPHAMVPREHPVLALCCLELFGGYRAVAYYCEQMRSLANDRSG